MRRLGAGREAEIFEHGDGTVLRLFRPGYGTIVDQEEVALRAARSGGAPVPAVFGRESVDGRVGLVLERVDGRDQMTNLGRRPWRFPRVAAELGRVHVQLHGVAAPEATVAARERLQRRIEHAGAVDARHRDRALAVLADLPDGDRLLHGDLHPGNVLAGRTGPMVVDWTNASRGDPDGDVARTVLMLRLGAPPPGTSALLRAIDRAGRRSFGRRYLRAYTSRRPVDPVALEEWLVPQAAARYDENIEEEFDDLSRFLDARVT